MPSLRKHARGRSVPTYAILPPVLAPTLPLEFKHGIAAFRLTILRLRGTFSPRRMTMIPRPVGPWTPPLVLLLEPMIRLCETTAARVVDSAGPLADGGQPSTFGQGPCQAAQGKRRSLAFGRLKGARGAVQSRPGSVFDFRAPVATCVECAVILVAQVVQRIRVVTRCATRCCCGIHRRRRGSGWRQ